MSTDDIKKDPLVKSLFEEVGAEHPSANFTNQIMDRVKAQSKENVFVYKPVIGRKFWLVLAVFGVTIIVYLMLTQPMENQPLNFFGNSVQLDTTVLSNLLKKIALSFDSQILKICFLAMGMLTMANLFILQWKSRFHFNKD